LTVYVNCQLRLGYQFTLGAPLRHHRFDAYSAEQVLLNKRQIYGGAPKVN